MEAYGDFKDLPRRATSDEILCDNSFNIAKNLNYDINVDLLQWSTIFLIESLLHVNASCGAISTQQLAEELHKPIIRKTKNVKYNIF